MILGCVVALGLGLGACSAASSVQGSLSDAIAGAEPGATLHIAPGRHEGSVVIDKPLTIVGEPGAIIVGTPGQPTISIVHTDNVTVRGLALEGGESGIYVLESENVVIDQVQVHDAEWHGIVAQDAEIEVLDCAVSGLLADRAQGIEIINSDRRPPSRVAGCRIEGPVFEGIVSHVSHVTFENNVVVGSSPRGIVVTEMSAGLMAGNHVSGATGAAYFCGDQSRCSVVDNSASGVAAGTPSYRSGMGHGLVVHFDSIAYVDGLQVDGAEGDQVLLMLDSRLSAVPLDLGFDRNGLPWTALLVVMAVLAVALLGGQVSNRPLQTKVPVLDPPIGLSNPSPGAPVPVPVGRAFDSVKQSRNPFDRNTTLGRQRIVGGVIFLVLFSVFSIFNRFPKLDTVQRDVDIVTAVEGTSGQGIGDCFQGFCIEATPEAGLLQRWMDFSVHYLWLVTIGMIFAFLVAGLTDTFFFPDSAVDGFGGWGLRGSLQGLAVGPAMTLCSACIVPVANSFRQRGASVSSTIAITQGSATLNAPALLMALAIFTPLLAGSRIVLSVLGTLLIGPMVAWATGTDRKTDHRSALLSTWSPTAAAGWGSATRRGLVDWMRSSVGFFFRLTPVMILAGFASGLALQWLTPATVSQYLGNHLLGIIIAATIGIMVNVPLMFEIPLVAGLMIVGMGTAPAAALLFTAAAAGPITFWGLAKSISGRGVGALTAALWILGVAGGLTVWGLDALLPG